MNLQNRVRVAVAMTSLVTLVGCASSSTAQTPAASPAKTPAPAVNGWLHWRGPQQNGTSLETNLPDKWEVGGVNHLWDIEAVGRGSPVVAGNRLYVWTYEGEGPDLQEVLTCRNAETGEKIWEYKWSDYLSDIIYNRYSIGAPTVDAETGNVYIQGTAGQVYAFNADGKLLWERSMMEEFGRLALPNGRTGAPVIDSDLVIIRGITGNWGREGPAADRFYAFDKRTGELVWRSTPGKSPPKDVVFGHAYLGWRNGQRVFYCGTGDGSITCANARTGVPLWRFSLSAVSVNASVVMWKDRLIAGHADENLDSSESGRIVALDVNATPETPKPSPDEPAVLGKDAEIWRSKEGAHTSSPTLVGDRLYQVNRTGELVCIDVKNGTTLWKKKLGTEQLHASIGYADGKLYVPVMYDGFYIIKPTDAGPEILSHTKLPGECLGAPAIWNGKIYVLTTKRLYCFGTKGDSKHVPPPVVETEPAPGPIARVMVRPEEALRRPGTTKTFRLFGVDANGITVKELTGSPVTWEKFVPPTALVRAEMDAQFNAKGELETRPDAALSAGAWKATVKDGDKEYNGFMRGRVVCGLPYHEDFESFKPSEQTKFSTPDVQYTADRIFAWPPLPWIGARFRWEVVDLDGNKVFAKALDRILFQRAFTLIGDPQLSNYTVEADVMSHGNRRMVSNVGLINQRYVVNLVGNWQMIQVFSNQERIDVSVPFKWDPNTWYRLKTRVDVAADGTGVVRAKAWKKSDPEPAAWTIEVPHKNAHKQGAPGIYGFSPQNRFAVFVDNVSVTPNK